MRWLSCVTSAKNERYRHILERVLDPQIAEGVGKTD
jgi:hypothetical protein